MHGTFWDRKEKPYVFLLFALPAIWMLYSVFSGRYFPDPAEPVMTWTGIWTIAFLTFTLSLTPLARINKLRWLSRYRRFLGLTTFWYALLHLLGYLVLHAGLSIRWILDDLIERPYIYAGTAAVLLLLILAVTSNRRSMRHLGKRWKVIHRFVYLATILVMVHLWWQVKSDISIASFSSLALAVPFLYWLINHPLIKKIKKIKKSTCA